MTVKNFNYFCAGLSMTASILCFAGGYYGAGLGNAIACSLNILCIVFIQEN